MDQTIEIKPPPPAIDHYKRAFINYISKILNDIRNEWTIETYGTKRKSFLNNARQLLIRLHSHLQYQNKIKCSIEVKEIAIKDIFEQEVDIGILLYLKNKFFSNPPEKRLYAPYIKTLSILDEIIQRLQTNWLTIIHRTIGEINEVMSFSDNLTKFIKPFEELENITSEITSTNISENMAFLISDLRSSIACYDHEISKYTYEDIKSAREEAWTAGWEAKSEYESNIFTHKNQWMIKMELED